MRCLAFVAMVLMLCWQAQAQAVRSTYTSGGTAPGTASAPKLNLGTNDFTLAGWYKYEALPTYGVVFSINSGSLPADSFAYIIIDPTRRIWARVRTGGSDVTVGLSGGTARYVTSNVWQHGLLTRKYGSNLSLYVDGQLAETVSAPALGAAVATNLQFFGLRANNEVLVGCLSDLVFLRRAVNAEEARTIANTPAYLIPNAVWRQGDFRTQFGLPSMPITFGIPDEGDEQPAAFALATSDTRRPQACEEPPFFRRRRQ